MSSPYVITEGGAIPCLKDGCPPFFIREWEMSLLVAFLVFVVIYLVKCKSQEYLKGERTGAYVARSSTQALMGSSDTRAGHQNSEQRGYPENAVMPGPLPLYALLNDPVAKEAPAAAIDVDHVKRGRFYSSRGPSVKEHMDFARVDDLDKLGANEAPPTHQPETSDQDLETLLR